MTTENLMPTGDAMLQAAWGLAKARIGDDTYWPSTVRLIADIYTTLVNEILDAYDGKAAERVEEAQRRIERGWECAKGEDAWDKEADYAARLHLPTKYGNRLKRAYLRGGLRKPLAELTDDDLIGLDYMGPKTRTAILEAIRNAQD